MSIREIKKILLKKGFKVSKLKKDTINSKYKSVYLTTLASIIVIGFFAILPSINFYISKYIERPKVVENYSKKYLEKVLSGEKLITDSTVDQELDQRYLYEDVEFNDGPSKTVRVEAFILQQLFEDEKYKLNLVRKNKIVKPFEVGMLPQENWEFETKKRFIYQDSFTTYFKWK